MNTGHDSSIATVHANTARDALTRIENVVQMGTFNLPSRAIRSQSIGAIDLIVQVERMRDGVRRVCQLSEICGLEGDVTTMNDRAAFEFDNEDAQGNIVGHYVAGNSRPGFLRRLEHFGLDRAWGTAMQTL